MGWRVRMSVVQGTEGNVGLGASSWAGAVGWRTHMPETGESRMKPNASQQGGPSGQRPMCPCCQH